MCCECLLLESFHRCSICCVLLISLKKEYYSGIRAWFWLSLWTLSQCLHFYLQCRVSKRGSKIIYPLEIISGNGSPRGKTSKQLFPSKITVSSGRMKEEGTVVTEEFLASRVQSCSIPLGDHLFPCMMDPLAPVSLSPKRLER